MGCVSGVSLEPSPRGHLGQTQREKSVCGGIRDLLLGVSEVLTDVLEVEQVLITD